MKNTKENFEKRIGFVSLGCDKNRVDTENIITSLVNYNFLIEGNPQNADIIVINTCAFLLKSREEAVNTILEMAEYKKTGLEKLIVIGCLPQADDGTLNESLPEVDAFLVPSDYNNIAQIIYNLYNQPFKQITTSKTCRKLTTPAHYAYLKVSEGCNNGCTYCKIPYIKGKYISYPLKDIIDEAKLLAQQGVSELILIAQDVTRYGLDLTPKSSLIKLLNQLEKINGIKWIRLHYCYPEMITPALIDVLAKSKKIVKYIDIPFQHASTQVLKAMNRRSNEQSLRLLVEMLRDSIPDIAIRSTFMVGFPGESRQDFKILKKFLKDYKLNNVGFFAYSREEGTPSYNFNLQVSEKTKLKRLKAIQKLQSKIAYKRNLAKVNKICTVLCDGFSEEMGLYFGRDYSMSPDVDFIIYFEGNNKIKTGQFVNVKITAATQNYLKAEVI